MYRSPVSPAWFCWLPRRVLLYSCGSNCCWAFSNVSWNTELFAYARRNNCVSSCRTLRLTAKTSASRNYTDKQNECYIGNCNNFNFFIPLAHCSLQSLMWLKIGKTKSPKLYAIGIHARPHCSKFKYFNHVSDYRAQCSKWKRNPEMTLQRITLTTLRLHMMDS